MNYRLLNCEHIKVVWLNMFVNAQLAFITCERSVTEPIYINNLILETVTEQVFYQEIEC